MDEHERKPRSRRIAPIARRIRKVVAYALLVAAPCCRGSCWSCDDRSQPQENDGIGCGAITPSDECFSNSDCFAGQTCDSGECVASTGCTIDSDCPIDCELCLPQGNHGICSPSNCDCDLKGHSCFADGDCCSGECSFGECVEKTCTPLAGACAKDADCCEGTCDSGTCAILVKCTPGMPPEVAAEVGGDALFLTQDVDRLYWVAGGNVLSLKKTGGQPVILASGDFTGAIASNGPKLFWGAKDAIWKLDPASMVPAVVATIDGSPWMLAVRDYTDDLYWSASEALGADTIFGITSADPAAFKLAQLSDMSGQHAIAADTDNVYYVDGETLHAVDLTSGADSVIYDGGPSTVIDSLAVGATEIYFADQGVMHALALAPGAMPLDLADAPNAAGGITLDPSDVFWTANGGASPSASFPVVQGVSIAGGSPVDVATGEPGADPGARSPVADVDCVYWIAANDQKIMKVARPFIP
jgi:hypothetical protein